MNEASWMKGPPRSVLLATDLSARSDRALDRATLLAKQWQAHLTVLHVLEAPQSVLDAVDELPSWKGLPNPLTIVKQNVLEDLSELADSATILVEEGSIVETIMRVANNDSSELIAIGVARNELLGVLFLGRTVDRLLRRSHLPLLVIKNRARRPYRNIVVATDFSESSRHALVAAMRFFPETVPTLFHAYDPPMVGLMSDAASYRREYRKIVEQECEAFLRSTDISKDRLQKADVLIEYGTPSRLLRDYAVDKQVDLVVIGTHGRTAIFDVLIGTVAKHILDEVPCDILVVREPRAQVEGQ